MAEQKLRIKIAGHTFVMPAEAAMAEPYHHLSFREALLRLARDQVKEPDLAALIEAPNTVFEQYREKEAPREIPLSPATNWGEFLAQFREQQEQDLHVGLARRFTGGHAAMGGRS